MISTILPPPGELVPLTEEQVKKLEKLETEIDNLGVALNKRVAKYREQMLQQAENIHSLYWKGIQAAVFPDISLDSHHFRIEDNHGTLTLRYIGLKE